MKQMRNPISWDEYFMGIAQLSALRSKDPNTQVGACLISPDKRIIGVGYNGFPSGCDETCFSWEREGDPLNTKYPYVVHAEQNAIFNSNASLKGATCYVTLFPCQECAKALIQTGVKQIVYLTNPYNNTTNVQAAKRLFDATDVKYFPYETLEC